MKGSCRAGGGVAEVLVVSDTVAVGSLGHPRGGRRVRACVRPSRTARREAQREGAPASPSTDVGGVSGSS